jgi:hypothetical protein
MYLAGRVVEVKFMLPIRIISNIRYLSMYLTLYVSMYLSKKTNNLSITLSI